MIKKIFSLILAVIISTPAFAERESFQTFVIASGATGLGDLTLTTANSRFGINSLATGVGINVTGNYPNAVIRATDNTNGARIEAVSGSVTAYLYNNATNARVGTSSNHSFDFATNNTVRYNLSTSGDLTQNATNGGQLVMSRTLNTANTGILLGQSAKVADQQAASIISSSDVNTVIQALFQQSTNDVNGNLLYFNKTRKTDFTADTIVANGDAIATFVFQGADGTSFRNAAAIKASVDGAPGASDMPGRLDFQTSADGSASLLSRWGVDNTGALQQNGTSGGNISFSKANTGIVMTTSAAVTAAGSTTADATVLSSWNNNITTASAGQGVRWWGGVAGFSVFTVRNQTAVTVKLYPPSGGSILGYGADVGADIAVNATVFCFQTTTTNIACGEAPNI